MQYFVFKQFARIIKDNFGIHYSYKKKLVLQNRIDLRLKELKLSNYQEYLEYIENNSDELQELANKATTNTTYFFREPEHFDFIRRVVFPSIMKEKYPMLRIWSAPCSTGQELYSIAIEAEEFKKDHKDFHYKIYGSDISEPALNYARQGIYPIDDLTPIKKAFRVNYFQTYEEQFKIESEIRRKCVFYKMNFIEDKLATRTQFDVIFCRNMLMYFQKKEQEVIVNRLLDQLKTGGFFIISQNESLHGLNVPLTQVKHSIFQKK